MHVPLPPVRDNVHQWVNWAGAFTPEQVERCVALCAPLPRTGGTTFDSQGRAAAVAVRHAEVAWLRPSPASTWLFDKLAYICDDMNSKFFRFDLTGFHEPLQYTTYEARPGQAPGHYTWHMDRGSNITPRKLSLVIQLSAPEDYDGGDLELFYADPAVRVPRGLGNVVGFPSFVMHRVTPVTRGLRRSLVVWVGGPGFR
ncbi:MAG: 2OG-Fe(II) oxygenase [Kofleriaceae bacterium]